MYVCTVYSVRGAPEPGGQGGQLPTQLLDPYVLSHATSFLTLFSACPPNFKLLPRLLRKVVAHDSKSYLPLGCAVLQFYG